MKKGEFLKWLSLSNYQSNAMISIVTWIPVSVLLFTSAISLSCIVIDNLIL